LTGIVIVCVDANVVKLAAISISFFLFCEEELTILSETARLMLRLTRSKLENMTHTQSITRKSNCGITKISLHLQIYTNHKKQALEGVPQLGATFLLRSRSL
jgi:hypothetical protein